MISTNVSPFDVKRESSKELIVQEERSTGCPPWFTTANSANDSNCTCIHFLPSVVTCTPCGVSIELCHCMTVDLQTNITMVGSCPFSCLIPMQWFSDPTTLNFHTCGLRYHRTGQLCAQCQSGNGPLVYSYSLECVSCSSSGLKETLLFLSAAFLPLTAFCFIIIFFRISIARPPLSTFVLVSQVMAALQHMQIVFTPRPQEEWTGYASYNSYNDCWKMFASFYGIWNLDFFRALYPPICLSPNMTNLQVAAMEYAIGLYPIALLAITYMLVRLYDRGCTTVFCNWACRPIHSCLAHVRREFSIRSSLIDAFASFIVLSYIKIGYTTFLILQPTRIFSSNGTDGLFVFIDPSIQFFRIRHLTYAVPAVVITVVFNVLPLMLLFLYPLRCFQKCLNRCHLRCRALHTFVDAFQGCYKNGTDGTRDYRWFAGVHLLMRFVIVIAYDLTRYHNQSSCIMALLCSVYLSVIAVLQPYKVNTYLKIDALLFLNLSFWSSVIVLNTFCEKQQTKFEFVLLTFLVITALIPFTYFNALVLYWLTTVKRLHRKMLNCLTSRIGTRMRLLSN